MESLTQKSLLSWSVREALIFDGSPKGAMALAKQLDEPLREIRDALSDLAWKGQVKYLGGGLYTAKEEE